jgi:tetratricopeptide (TPR) repeat protein
VLPKTERPTKLVEACEKYAEAIRIKPDMHEGYLQWDIALRIWSEVLPNTERSAKLDEACEKFSAAIRIKPDMSEAYFHWGTALILWAEALPENERPAKLNEARKKFSEAVRINPDKHDAYNNWGSTLLHLYWTLPPDSSERFSLLKEARLVLGRAEEIQRGAASYNLACVAALLNDHEEARKWLLIAQEFGIDAVKDCESLKNDRDLNNLRGLDWFEVFVSKTCDNA